MKTLFIATVMTILAAPSIQAATQYSANCKEAAGYYGNLEVLEKRNHILVSAQQGFSYKLSTQLNIKPESYKFVIPFSRKNCRINPRTHALHCRSKSQKIYLTSHQPSDKNQMIASAVQLQIKPNAANRGKSVFTKLDIRSKVNGVNKTASAQFTFGSLGGCAFK